MSSHVSSTIQGFANASGGDGTDILALELESQ